MPPTHLLFLMSFLSLFHYCSGLVCDLSCTYYRSSGVYYRGCATYSLDPNYCTACDTRFYIYNASSSVKCGLNPQTIYNTTTLISYTKFNTSYGNQSYDSLNWYYLYGYSYSVSTNVSVANSYGMRCRIAFYTTNPSAGFYPQVFFRVGINSAERVEILAAQNMGYSFNQFIYTSRYFATPDNQTFISIYRTDSDTVNYFIYHRDVLCLNALCVSNCVSCTSLKDCSYCTSGYFLDKYNHCVSVCPDGQYNSSTTVCSDCSPYCQKCSINSTYCSVCQQTGIYQSFLYLNQCYTVCPSGTFKNYDTHICYCPSTQYYYSSNICSSCHTNCMVCTSSSYSSCTKCNLGYYLQLPTTLNTCLSTCPAAQYTSQLQLSVCLYCDTSACVTCANISTNCTSCTFSTNNRWLYNYTCLYKCPDGYGANNSTYVCDRCEIGMYSFQNSCHTQCPQYYTAFDIERACAIVGGFPIVLTFDLVDNQTMSFTLSLKLGLKASILTALNTSWTNNISLYVARDTEDSRVVSRRLLYLAYTKIAITNAIITNTSIVLYSSPISAQYFYFPHKFKINFTTNLYGANTTIYSLSDEVSTNDYPQLLKKYFTLNSKPYYLIGITLCVIALIPLLMNVSQSYKMLINYIQMLQVIGVVFYSLYPTASTPDVYSYVLGFQFANFGFMYNVPAVYIQPCTQCKSFISYSFVIGDMNWLRLFGSILIILVILIIVCSVMYAFKPSRNYSKYFIKVIADFVMVKMVHCWCASLVFAGLNLYGDYGDVDVFGLGMHFWSYVGLLGLGYFSLKNKQEIEGDLEKEKDGREKDKKDTGRSANTNKMTLWESEDSVQKKIKKQQKIGKILSFSSLFIIASLASIISLAPDLICSLMMLVSFIQWFLHICLFNSYSHYHYHHYYSTPMMTIKTKNDQILQYQASHSHININNIQHKQTAMKQIESRQLCLKLQTHFYHATRAITCILIGITIMVKSDSVIIGTVSGVLGVLVILMFVLVCLLHQQKKKQQIQPVNKNTITNVNKMNSVQFNQTFQNMEFDKQFSEKYPKTSANKDILTFDVQNDDVVVGRRFKNNSRIRKDKVAFQEQN